MTEQSFLTSLQISGNDAVYRQAHASILSKMPSDKKKRFPNEAHFKPDSDGLSVNWSRYLSPEEVYHLIGLSFKLGTTDFKDYKAFKIFKLPVEIIRSIEGIEDVVHTPVLNGNPAPIGSPNNYAHASIIYQDDEEIRLKLSDYCQFLYDDSYIPIDIPLLEIEINELRGRLDDTRYHRLELFNPE